MLIYKYSTSLSVSKSKLHVPLGVSGPSTWYILDWDQRRTIAVTMDESKRARILPLNISRSTSMLWD